MPGSTVKVPDSVLRKQEIAAKTDTSKPVREQKEQPRPIAEAEQEQSSTVHVVKSGESLGLIASKYSVSVNDLMSWNNLSSNKIIIGQKIKVKGGKSSSPSVSSTKPAESKSQQKPATNPSGAKFFYYTIQSGDNLWDLADQFNVTVSQIKKLNNINNASYLKPGQKIKIPK